MKINFKSKKFWIILVIILVVVIGGFYYWKGGQKAPEYVTAKVYKGDLKQTVSATGSIKAAEDISLNFKTTGKISDIKVKVGDEVKAGQELARLDAKDLAMQVQQAQANLDAARANLKKIEEGASPEDINVTKESVNSAQVSYDNAVKNLDAVRQKALQDIQSSQQSYDDSIVDYNNVVAAQNQNLINARDNALAKIDNNLFLMNDSLDKINIILTDSSLSGTFSIMDFQSKVNSQNSYDSAKTSLTSSQPIFDQAKATKSDSDIDQALTVSLRNMNEVLGALSDMSLALINSVASQNISETSLDTYKSTITAYQSSLNSALTSTQTAQQTLANTRITKDTQIASAQSMVNTKKEALNTTKAASDLSIQTAQNQVAAALSSYDYANSQLSLKQAPARDVDLNAQRAVVRQLQAALSLVSANYSDTVLRAPVDGIVTKVNYEKGETTSLTSTAPVIVMLSKNKYEIEVDISESDIAKVKVGDLVTVDFDAFGPDRKFDGHVVKVDPAETVIQDVVYYKVTISLDKEETDVKPGMTANIIIKTAEKSGVLIIPQRAVKRDDQGQRYVDILENNEKVSKDVEIGLKGDDGLSEVLSGLIEGEEVITFTKTSS